MKYLLLGITLTFFTSCGTYRYVYTASPANNPIFTKKGDSKLAGYYSSSGGDGLGKTYAGGLDLQGAYAFDNHWAITASYMGRKEKDLYGDSFSNFDTSVVNYKRNLLELGGGYFTPLNKKKTIVFNMFGGFGKGKFSFTDHGIDNNDQPYSRMHQSNLSRWFIQPSINFLPGSYVRISYAMKFTLLNYHNINTNYTPEELSSFSLQNLGVRSFIFAEPSLSFQIGMPSVPWVKLDAILSSVTNNKILTEINVRTSNVSIGLNFDPSKMHSKKK